MTFKSILSAVSLLLLAQVAHAQVLRIGLASDPDILDPTLYRTFSSSLVLTALCDRLFEMTQDYQIVSQLVTDYSWTEGDKALTLKLRHGVRFHDWEPLDAAAVKYSIERHIIYPGSIVRSSIAPPVTGVDVVDEHTVTIRLSSPFAPLLGLLAGRAGMMVSPKAAEAMGDRFGEHPVCAGPFKFVQRVAQDHIDLERFSEYWGKEKVFLDRIVYRPVPDTNVRLFNLKSGDLDLIEQVAATDLTTIRNDDRLHADSIVGVGYAGIIVNVGNGERSQSPLGRDARVREAFELALDRDIINQVVFDGEQMPNNQWISPASPFHVNTLPVLKRDVAKAKELLQAAGEPNPVVHLLVVNIPERIEMAQVVQSMVKEAGFDVRLLVTELTSALQTAAKGEFEAFQINFIGGLDPDLNVYLPLSCRGSFNYGKYCNPELDHLLNLGRTTLGLDARRTAYEKAATIVFRDKPIIYLYQSRWHWAYSAKLSGFQVFPDGAIRATNLRLK